MNASTTATARNSRKRQSPEPGQPDKFNAIQKVCAILRVLAQRSPLRLTDIADADLFESEADMLRDPLYASLGEFGLKWFAAIGFRSGPALWGLTIQRSPKEAFLH